MAASQITVTTCTTNFLHIILNSSWHIIVDYRLNITLVNTHTEGDGAAHHAHFIVDKLLLSEVSLLVSLTCMVRRGRDSVLIQESGNMVSCAPLSSE